MKEADRVVLRSKAVAQIDEPVQHKEPREEEVLTPRGSEMKETHARRLDRPTSVHLASRVQAVSKYRCDARETIALKLRCHR
jgi:hypothetical protein